MKNLKKMMILPVVGIFVFTTSCKKCEECHYEMTDASGAEMEMEIGEYCGDDLEAIEKNGYVVDGTTYEVHCHDH